MIRQVMAGFVSLSVLVAATAQEDTKKQEAGQQNQTDVAKKIGDADDKNPGDQQQTEQSQRTDLPESLTQLDLTEEQKGALLAIYRDSDMKSQQLWDRVQGLHHQAISMEAAVIAAARLEGHDHSAHQGENAPSSATDATRGANSAVNGTGANESKAAAGEENPAPNAGDKGNAEKRKAGKNRDENRDEASRNRQRDGKPADAQQDSNGDNTAGWQLKDGDLKVVAIRVGIAQPDGKVREYLLTQPGDNAPSGQNKAFQSHQSQLSQIWKEIHDGHEQLVELEATTIVNVEAQLTKPQLEKLDTTQAQASNTPNIQNTPKNDPSR